MPHQEHHSISLNRYDLDRFCITEACRAPRLSPKDEKKLLEQVIIGRQAQEFLDKNRPISEEVQEQINQGLLARNKLIEHNQRLVVSIVKKFYRPGEPFSRTDLLNAGNFGLIRAIEKFDPEKGGRLSTYAFRFIKNAIIRYVQQHKYNVRLPYSLQNYFSQKIAPVIECLLSQLEREPTIEEIAAELKISPEQLRKLMIPKDFQLPLNEIRTTTVNGLDSGVALSELKELIARALDDLSPRQAKVLSLRFGLSPEQGSYSRTQIAKKFGLSYESIRQIEFTALKRLSLRFNKVDWYL